MSNRLLLILSLIFVATSHLGCAKTTREDLDYDYHVEQEWSLPEIQFGNIVQFESVFWEPDDSVSLRKLITEDALVAGCDVLEIGTGTGLLSILCAQNQANSVLATDINPSAVANARYNVAMLDVEDIVTVRTVKPDAPGAFEIVPPKKRFDVIISNPPWEDGKVSEPAEHAFYDPGFALMDSILDGLPRHLNPGGKCLLAYGHRPALERLRDEVAKRGYQFEILDERKIDDLERDFLPGMLVEIRLPKDHDFGESN